jgi:DDE family transposase
LDHPHELGKVLWEFFHWNRARIGCIVPLLVGIIQLGTVNLMRIASTFPGEAQQHSHYKRLQRLFCEFPLELNLIAQFIAHLLPLDQFKLTLDRTNWKLGKININFLVLGVAYRGIAFPLFWPTLAKQGNSNTQERITLIERFIAVFGRERIACLLADREFIGRDWFGYLIENKILFRIRIKCNTCVSNSRGFDVPVENLLRGLPRNTFQILPGKRRVWGHRLYIIGFKMADGELVIIATQEHPETALADYKERWQIETLFACLKTRGFCLESTHLTHPERLEKLFAFLAIAFSWAHLIGEWLHEIKPLILKKHGRQAKSFFRHGLDYLRGCLFHHQEPLRQQAFHQAIEQLLKRLSRIPQDTLTAPTPA